MLELTFNNAVKNRRYSKNFFSRAIKEALVETGLDKKRIGLSINLIGKKRIRSLNQTFRSKNEPTDVLSFPIENTSPISKYAQNSAILELGDIFICPEMAGKNIIFLTVHGFLHLLGYDHEKSVKEKIKMTNLENKILNKLESD